MGRYSEPLAERFVEVLDPWPGQRALDVGCGPGALTAQLVSDWVPTRSQAIDPSPTFVEACRSRFPGIDVRSGRGRDTAVRCRHVRRHGCPAGRALHDRSRGRAARDGAGHAPRRNRRRMRLGSRRRRRTACRVLAGRARHRSGGAATSPSLPVLATVTWPQLCQSRPGRRQVGPVCSTVRMPMSPRSPTGGNRSRSASDRPVRTWPNWTSPGGMRSGPVARTGCLRRRSMSSPQRGACWRAGSAGCPGLP